MPMSFLLMAGTASNFVVNFSYIARKNITCKTLLHSYSSESISTLSNVKQDTVATLTLNYEVYQMYKPTELITTYHPAYVFLYQADVYVNNAVKYKGGMFNWFDGCHAGFLNYIDITTVFNGTSGATHKYFTPSLNSDDDCDGYRILRGVDPQDDIYAENSQTSDKQTDYNRADSGKVNDNLESFTDAVSMYTNSYYDSNYDMIRNYGNYIGSYDSRLIADIDASQTVGSNSLTFDQRFTYNNELTATFDGVSSAPNISVTHDSQGLYSGPCTNGADDSKPFNFCFYGAIGVECPNKPSSISITLQMDTYHGSHTVLDTFESNASRTFTVSLN